MQESTLRLKSLNELFNNDSSSIEKQGDQREIANTQICFIHPKDIQNFKHISNDVSSNNNNDEDEVVKTKGKNEKKRRKNEVFKENNENKLIRGTKKSSKNSTKYSSRGRFPHPFLESKIFGKGNYQTSPENLNNLQILRRGNYQTPSENLNKILGEESYQTSPESLNNSKILERGSYQTPPENSNNPRIPEKSFRASLINSTPVNWKEGSLTKPYCAIRLDFIKGRQKKRESSSLEKIKLPRAILKK